MKMLKKLQLTKLTEKGVLSYIFILALLLIIFMFRKPLFIFLLILIGGLSTIHKRFTQVSFGFELITFFSVVITFAHGIAIGLISMIIMVFISHFSLGRICITMFAKIVVYTLILVVAAFLTDYSIITVGIVLAVVFYIATLIINIFFLGFNPVSSLASAAGGIIFNYIFFTKLAETLLKIIV